MSQSSGSDPWDLLESIAVDATPAAFLNVHEPAPPRPEPAQPDVPPLNIETHPSPQPAAPTPPPLSPTTPPKPTASQKPAASKPARFRLRLGPEPEESEELITPEKVKSWSASLIFHTLLLTVLALTILSVEERPPKVIETGLPAGDPAGSDLGLQFTGGLGIDDPLSMPYAALESNAEPQPMLAPITSDSLLSEVSRNLPTPPTDADASARGGGTALTGTGQAGRGDGFGVAKFGLGGKELVNNVEIKVGNPQFTLIWNTSSDIDLHVLEPGGSHIYWESRRGSRGGELDVDDVDGLGPENVYWGGGLNKGNGPPGEYKWYIHYYGGREGNIPTRWKVRLKYKGDYRVFEGRLNAIGQRSKIYSFVLDESETGPGTGPEAPQDETPREARPGEMPGFERPNGTFENPPSAANAGSRPFGREATQERDEPPALPNPTSAPRTESIPARPPPAAATTPPTSTPPTTRPEPRRDASGWAIIEPADAGFRASFPAAPFEETRALENRPGQPEVFSWNLDRGEGGLSVVFLELPQDRRRMLPLRLLDEEARAIATEAGDTSPQIKNLEINGEPAREVTFDVPDRIVAGGGRTRARLVVRNGRLYRIAATGTSSFVAGPDIQKFLDGFGFPE